jgi:hypothetical protein
MASQKPKFETDAERMKSRSFLGYLKDRATGSADFSKPEKASPQTARPNPLNRLGLDEETKKEIGMAKGGAVRGYGAARGGKKCKIC